MTKFLLILACIANIIYAIHFGKIAVDKGHSKWYYLASLLFGLYTWIDIAALPDYRTSARVYRQMESRKDFVTEKKEPKKEIEYDAPSRPPVAGGWTCSCGRSHAAYVSSCPCGKSKYDK